MKFVKRDCAVLLGVASMLLTGGLRAQENSIVTRRVELLPPVVSGASVTVNPNCNGARFNLEPRLNAGPQNSESVDFLLNRVGPGQDLVVGAGNDQAGNGLANRMGGFDGYYVFRQGTNCAANFEGTVAAASGVAPLDPTVVADSARDAFFFSDTLFGSQVAEVARTTATTLLNTTACPNGTQVNGSNPNCWPIVGIANFTNSAIQQATLLGAHMTVDPRTAGTGAGDVYVVAQYENSTNFPAVSNIQILACANQTVTCGAPIAVSGSDPFAAAPYVQVRADGTITISYWTFTLPFGTLPNPVNIKFVTCTPQGAPMPPVCAAATLVATSNVPSVFVAGDSGFKNSLFPKHASRLEADGKTFTTFLVYDRCRSIIGKVDVAPPCAKVDVAVTSSNNGGATWSAPEVVEAVGHQFFGMIRADASTQTINVAYYSTQEDLFSQRAKIRLRQIAPGATTLGTASVLTTDSTDPDSGVQDSIEPGGGLVINFGNRIGLAAAGTGTAGQSKVYVHYTWNNVFGTLNGTAQPDQNNTLIGASY